MPQPVQQQTTSMYDVFVSYSRKDVDFVHRLVDGLNGRDRKIWVDFRDIPATADWFDEIERGIEAADGFLYVISPDSVHSEVCARELDAAVGNGKRIIPLLRRPVPDSDVPAKVAAHNWIDASDDGQLDEAIDTLIKALDTDLEHVRGHTRWLGDASEWERSGRDSSLLLRGSELAEAEAWQARAAGRQPEITPLQAEWISASREAAGRRQRRLVGAVSVALLVSIGLTIFALISRHQAVQNEQTARSRELLAQAQNQYDTDPELSLLLARQAYSVRPADVALDRVRESLLRSFVRQRFVEDYRVMAALPSPDGKRVLIATQDGAVRIRDLATGRQVSRVADAGTHTGNVTWAPDSKQFATGAPDRKVRIFDADTGAQRFALPVGGAVLDLAWSPDGSRIAVSWTPDLKPTTDGLGHGRVSLIDPASRDELARFRVGSGSIVQSLAWSPDGKRFAAAAAGGDVELRDGRQGQLISALLQGPRRIRPTVVWARDANVVATAAICEKCANEAEASGIRVWNGATGRRLATVPRSLTTVAGLSANGKYLAFVNANGQGQVYYIPERRTISPLVAVFRNPPTHVALSGTGIRVAVAEQTGAVRVFDASTGEEVASLLGHRDRITSLSFDRDNFGVLTGSEDATVREWAIDLPRPVSQVDAHPLLNGQPAVSPGGRFAAFPEEGGGVVIRRVATGEEVLRLPASMGIAAGAAWDLTGRWLVTVSGQGTELDKTSLTDVRIYDGHTLRPVARLETPTPASDVQFSDDGGRLAVGGIDGTVRVYDPRQPKALRVLDAGRGEPVFGLAFAHGLVLANGKGRTATLWNAESGKRLHDLSGHGRPIDTGFIRDLGVRSAAITRDGRRAATGGVDGAIFIWNAQTGKREQSFAAHRGQITSLAFSPDGSTLASGSSDGNVKLWRAATGDRIATLPAALPAAAGLPTTSISVGWSRDGRTVFATGGIRARFWDAATGRQLFDVFAGSAAVGDDGREVAVAGGGAEAVFDCALCVGPDALLALAKRRSTRELTPEERRRFVR